MPVDGVVNSLCVYLLFRFSEKVFKKLCCNSCCKNYRDKKREQDVSKSESKHRPFSPLRRTMEAFFDAIFDHNDENENAGILFFVSFLCVYVVFVCVQCNRKAVYRFGNMSLETSF